MGYFDEVKGLVGRGMNVADRKSQELRLQGELNRIRSSLTAAYAALGKVVYAHPTLSSQVQDDCPGEYGGIASLLREEQEVRSRMEDLRRQAVSMAAPASTPRRAMQFPCPSCGMAVTLDQSFCPNCADNLATLKQQYRMCPNCHTYHSSDSMFCMECGSRTVEIPVAQSRQSFVAEQPPLNDQVSVPSLDVESDMGYEEPLPVIDAESTQDAGQGFAISDLEDSPVAPQVHACPNCGSEVEEDSVFCGECGYKLIG